MEGAEGGTQHLPLGAKCRYVGAFQMCLERRTKFRVQTDEPVPAGCLGLSSPVMIKLTAH